MPPHDNIMSEAVKKFGLKNQMDKTQEECAELIVALSHYKFGRAGSEKDVVEELADVMIMTRQLALVFGIQDVEEVIDHKLDRLYLVLKG